MRYSTYFLGTDDPSIKNQRPGLTNILIKKNAVDVHFRKTIPIGQITSMGVEYNVSDKTLSAGKMLGGAIIAGPLGAAVGAAMGGKQVSSTLTIAFLDDHNEQKHIILESKSAALIKSKFDRSKSLFIPNSVNTAQPSTMLHTGFFKRGLINYYAWPLIVYRKLKNSRNDR